MSNKSFRYIAWGLGSVITIVILFINDRSFQRYGFFASDINKTIAFEFFEDIARAFGAGYSGAEDGAYFLWYCTLVIGIYASWKFRHKTAGLITRVVNNIDEKA